jgi:hypothetical protein
MILLLEVPRRTGFAVDLGVIAFKKVKLYELLSDSRVQESIASTSKDYLYSTYNWMTLNTIA